MSNFETSKRHLKGISGKENLKKTKKQQQKTPNKNKTKNKNNKTHTFWNFPTFLEFTAPFPNPLFYKCLFSLASCIFQAYTMDGLGTHSYPLMDMKHTQDTNLIRKSCLQIAACKLIQTIRDRCCLLCPTYTLDKHF